MKSRSARMDRACLPQAGSARIDLCGRWDVYLKPKVVKFYGEILTDLVTRLHSNL